MKPRRPSPIKSDLTTGPAAVLRPAPAAARPQAARATGSAGRASTASKTGGAGTAGKTGSGVGVEGEHVVKVTARLGSALAGRCRAAYIDGLLRGGPASFEAWIAEALEEKLAREEERRGRAYEPVGTGRVPRGRR